MTPKLDLTLAAPPTKPLTMRAASRAETGFSDALALDMPKSGKPGDDDARKAFKIGTFDRILSKHGHAWGKGDDQDKLAAEPASPDEDATDQASSVLALVAAQAESENPRKDPSAMTDATVAADTAENSALGANAEEATGETTGRTRAANARAAQKQSLDVTETGDAQALQVPSEEAKAAAKTSSARVGTTAPAEGQTEAQAAPAPATPQDAPAQPVEASRRVQARDAKSAAPSTQVTAPQKDSAASAGNNAKASTADAPNLGASVQVTQQPQSASAATVTSALGSDPVWASYFRELPTGAPQAVKSLRIQLHPAELGMVTANLRVSGDSVTVELEAETTQARDHLASDADSIVSSLKAIGVDVDKVTVKLVEHASQNVDRGDGQMPRGFAGEAGAGSNRERQSNSPGWNQSGDGSSTRDSATDSRAPQGADGRYI